MKKFDFTKMHGLGNDFVIIDERDMKVNLSRTEIISVANRHTGIGCDQLITIGINSESNILIRFFNSDGEEVSACGNGSRCVARMLMEENNASQINIYTKAGLLSCKKISNNIISINLGVPKLNWQEIPLNKEYDTSLIHFELNNISISNPYFVNVGNPHAIFFVDNLNNFNIEDFGPLIENDKMFPEKCNVTIAQVISPNHIKINVWERGAGKTLACGTAACAATVAAYLKNLTINKIVVSLPGGDLDIEYNSDIVMSGATELSFKSSFKIN
ncbi:diaminopimelate epimerase [Pelagibacterales bacterium]|nr:diaminopimelate epimerase [Pelagibacterales bacterium]